MKTSSSEEQWTLTLIPINNQVKDEVKQFPSFKKARNYCRSRIGKGRIYSHGIAIDPTGKPYKLVP